MIRRPWDIQPHGVHPKPDAGAVLFWDANGTTGPIQKALTRHGLGRVFSSTSLTLERSGNPAGGFMFVAVVDATAVAFFPMILTADVGASDVVELRLFDNTGRPEFAVKPSGGGYIEARSATSIVGVGSVTLVGVYKPSGVVELWQDGRLVASASGSGGSVSWNATPFRLGARAIGAGFPFDGRILFAAVLDTQRSSESPAELSANPWQLFEARRIFVPVAAAGGALNIDLDSGSYAYTGQDATLAVTRAIDLDAGSYLYTGQTVTISYGRALSLDAGLYTYTGQTADFTIARKIDLDTGSYAYTGQDATLSYTPSGSTYNIDLDAGAYTYTGQAVDFTIARNLALDAGVYTYTGQDAGLAYSGASSVTIKAGSWLRYRVI